MFGRRSAQEQRAQATPWGDWHDVYNSGDPRGDLPPVTVSSAIQLLTVYGSTRFICEGISTLPLDTLRRQPDGTVVHLPTPPLLLRPTADLDMVAWLTQVLSSLLLSGNAYIRVLRNASNAIVELVPLDSAKVQVRRVAGRKTYLIEGHTYGTYDVIHIPGIMLGGADVGVSPVEAARLSIGQGISAQEFGARFFTQAAVPSGVIETPQELSAPKARELARTWSRLHSGKNKQHLPGVLQGGAQWKPIAITNEQAQFLETRGFTAAEIAGQMFLIDPSELGIQVLSGSNLTYANLEQRNARKLQVTFLPWLVRVEQTLTTLLPRPQYVKLNASGLLRGDTKTRYETYRVGIDSGILSVETAQALEDLPAQSLDKPTTFGARVDAVKQLVFAGFEPEAALAACGLDPITHTGVIPSVATGGTKA